MEKDNEKNKRVIFSEMPKRKGKDIESLLEPLQGDIKSVSNDGSKPASERNSKTQITPREKNNALNSDREIDGRRDTEKFPFQLKNGVMDPSESFFDFENENFLTNEDYIRQQIVIKFLFQFTNETQTQKNVEKPVMQAGLRPTPGIIQPASKTQDIKRRNNVSGKIWILDISHVQDVRVI